jgi:hypothetical protein
MEGPYCSVFEILETKIKLFKFKRPKLNLHQISNRIICATFYIKSISLLYTKHSSTQKSIYPIHIFLLIFEILLRWLALALATTVTSPSR